MTRNSDLTGRHIHTEPLEFRATSNLDFTAHRTKCEVCLPTFVEIFC